MPEPSEHWVTALQIIGTGAGVALWAFVSSYRAERNKVRGEGERGAEIVQNAVGAAFVDRSAAQALVELLSVAREILDIVRSYHEHNEEDRFKRQIREEIAASKADNKG